MKITALKTRLVNLPLARPIATAIHRIDSLGCALLTVETDQGLVGESYLFTLNAARLKSFDEMLRGFEHQLLGRDPHYVGAIWQAIWDEINPAGRKGVTIAALSTLDTACWDLIGKAADKPLHHLFGACRDRIPTYASGGLWLSQSSDELVADAERFVADGFVAMKIRIGGADGDEDVRRVRAVREAIGDDIGLIADLNQALSPKQAIRLGRELESCRLLWIEEPVAAHDLRGHAQVTAALATDIASGENEYTRFGMQAMIAHAACDILMPDLQRIGGLSEMLRAASLASAHHLAVSTHMFTEHSLCIAGAAANCISVEHMPWFAELFNEELELINGELKIPRRPGTGFTFNHQQLKKYRLG
ncbi:MAG: mandelate racemase/muconate lactonizing enzyme family protein [bacterium]